jgi:DNA-binding XRE family transcriptional regulator
MAVNVNDKIKRLGPAQRRKVEARARELIAEEMTLRELRKARKLTQVRMAKKLGITQDGVSRLEKRSDVLLSTLRKTIQAIGGNLSLIAGVPGPRASCAVRPDRRRGAWQAGSPQTVRRLTGKAVSVTVSKPGRHGVLIWRPLSSRVALSH